MKKSRDAVKLAVLLSLTVHVALGWWVLRGEGFALDRTKFLAGAQQQLNVQWLSPLAANPAQSPTPRALEAPKIKSMAQPAASGSQMRSKAMTIEAPRATERSLPIEAEPATTAAPYGQPLQLGLSDAALNADQARRQTPLTDAIQAQQVQSAKSKQARAFSPLDAAPSGIASEIALAGGARLIRFSGGGCIRLPNPADRVNGDTHKPVMGNC